MDNNLNPVWVWNSFDHLDINRHPYMFPDWTHANALLYTSDGNLLVSIRHQNWIIKIDYENGKGSGDVLWHLGQGGEFTLVGGTDPTDWTYAQHGPAFFGQASAGVFDLGVMDNGDDRAFPSGVTCQGTCPYTTVPIYHIDESALTATVVFHDILSKYSFFGGDVASLANGNVEYDLCSDHRCRAYASLVRLGSHAGRQPTTDLEYDRRRRLRLSNIPPAQPLSGSAVVVETT